MVEGPFGHDLAQRAALDREITAVFDEGQVYRINHCLGKEDDPRTYRSPARRWPVRADLE